MVLQRKMQRRGGDTVEKKIVYTDGGICSPRLLIHIIAGNEENGRINLLNYWKIGAESAYLNRVTEIKCSCFFYSISLLVTNQIIVRKKIN